MLGFDAGGFIVYADLDPAAPVDVLQFLRCWMVTRIVSVNHFAEVLVVPLLLICQTLHLAPRAVFHGLAGRHAFGLGLFRVVVL